MNREQKTKGKRSYIPLEPQPNSTDVITLKRNYMKLKANPEYRRRITTIHTTDTSCKNWAVVEYLGEHVTGSAHGNNKSAGRAPYVRTPTETMDIIVGMTRAVPVKAVYNKLIVDLDVTSAPRDTAVIRNKKKNDRAKQRIEDGQVHCANFADEWLAVFQQLQTNDIIRFIGASSNRVPSAVLYSDNQLRDNKAFCFNRSV